MEKSEFSKANRNVWDCGSTLYDSYELNSFKNQLNSAIANSPRSLSMPHLPQRHHHELSLIQQPPHPPPPSSHHGVSNNKSFKISRSFYKLLRFVFKISKIPRISSNSFHQVEDKYANKERFFVVYDKSDQPVLTTIPELHEFEIGGFSPEISSLVRKSASERFTAISTRISCA